VDTIVTPLPPSIKMPRLDAYLEIAQLTMQAVDTAQVQPSVNARSEAGDRNEQDNNRNDEKQDPVEE
jgi:hypothetical protein